MQRGGRVASQAPGLFDWTGGSATPGQIDMEARGFCSGDSGGLVVVNGEVVGIASDSSRSGSSKHVPPRLH